MQRAAPLVWQCIQPVIEQLGYQFVGALFGQTESGATLRVFIDHEKGIMLDDCAAVSHQLNGVLDVEQLIKEEFCLEISSPGLDRPLFTATDFSNFLGQTVQIRMSIAQEGNRKRFKGSLLENDSESVIIEVDGREYRLLLDEIDEAKLVSSF